MEIQKTNFASNHTSFGMRFIKNAYFTDTVKYAGKKGKLLNLDAALNILKNVNDGDILIMHGKSGEKVFSNFTIGKKSFPINASTAKVPEEATLEGILNLAQLQNSKLFRKFLGNDKLQCKITSADVIAKY